MPPIIIVLVGLVGACEDTMPDCAAWAASGECAKNSGFMLQGCCQSCAALGPMRHRTSQVQQQQPQQQSREAWETENLEVPYANSVIVDVDAAGLAALASSRGEAPIFTWFYAPWCKQCKLVRPSVEEAAHALSDSHITFAKLDCVADVEGKKFYGVTSYPTFKVLRGQRHRWVEMPRNRTAAIIAAAAAREAAGPFVWARTASELRAQLYEQIPSGVHAMDAVGKGEALALAVLSSANGAAARAFAHLAAGCSVRFSPMPFVAINDASLLAEVGLPPIALDHVAIVQLFSEPDGAPDDARIVPRTAVRPLFVNKDAPVDVTDEADADEYETCQWALAHRLPLLVDFDADPYWAKRAAPLTFIGMHLLLFLSPPHRDLARVVRAAAARFPRGSVMVMQFMVKDMDVGSNALLTRYGVHSVLDTPRLVGLDQRLETSENVNRQRVYKTTISEEGVVAFLVGHGFEPRGEQSFQGVKDEL